MKKENALVQEKVNALQNELRVLTGAADLVVMVYKNPDFRVKIYELAEIACIVAGIDVACIREKDRSHKKALARQLVAYFGKTHCRSTYNQIGAVTGGRDHTTVRNAFFRFKDLLEAGDSEAVTSKIQTEILIRKRLGLDAIN